MAYDAELCECSHPRSVHAMNMQTHSLTGHCYRWIENRTQHCPCESYRKAPDAY